MKWRNNGKIDTLNYDCKNELTTWPDRNAHASGYE